MSAAGPDGGGIRASLYGVGFDPEELRRRNPNAVAMDVLYLLTTSFFVYLALQGFWPAVIAFVPLATLLYFGLASSTPFFLAQLLTVGITVVGSYAGVVPL